MLSVRTAFLALSLLIVVACEESALKPDDRPVEATSLLGEPLHRPALSDDFRKKQEALLAEARADLEANPGDEAAWIWVGRRLAYLGRYQDAIAHFTQALEKFPDSHKLRRHRGHRYITTRQFTKALVDLQEAYAASAGMKDEIEPDGLPNAQNLPRSTMKTNIGYHLSLVEYLRGEYMPAHLGFESCARISPNDDMRVAALYWQYLTMRRRHLHDEARALLDQIQPEMDVIENDGYHRLLLLFKGELSEADLLAGLEAGVATPTVLYGVAQHRKLSGDDEGCRELLERIIEDGNWAAFGYIAAEADLVRARTLEP